MMGEEVYQRKRGAKGFLFKGAKAGQIEDGRQSESVGQFAKL